MISISRIPFEQAPWDVLDAYADRTPFQTRAWLEYLRCSQNGEPVIAGITEGDKTIGFFTGAVIRKMGMRILGSPFKGWGTPYLGFNLDPGADRERLIEPLMRFGFDTLRCHHVELVDHGIAARLDSGADDSRTFATMEIDLTPPEERLMSEMDGSCRRCIRKAEKSGVVVEIASSEGFAEEHYEQLKDVFARNGNAMPFGIQRVNALINAVHGGGDLLLLRARNSDGRNIATGIFPGRNDVAYFWGGASWREHQHVRPNELLLWRAMQIWKSRGVRVFDMGGLARYKVKYGAKPVGYRRIVQSRYAVLTPLRDAALRAWRIRCAIVAAVQRAA